MRMSRSVALQVSQRYYRLSFRPFAKNDGDEDAKEPGGGGNMQLASMSYMFETRGASIYISNVEITCDWRVRLGEGPFELGPTESAR